MALTAAMVTSPLAHAEVPSDNIHGSFGGVNVDTGKAEVDNIGDTTEVKWQVQLSKLLSSSDHTHTSSHAQILIPNTVDVTSIRLTHRPMTTTDDENFNAGKYESSVPAKEVSYEVPIIPVTPGSDVEEDFTPDQEAREEYGVSPFFESPIGTNNPNDADNEETFGYLQYGVTPSPYPDQPGWNAYQVVLDNVGVYTFEVTGTTKSEGKDTYIPIRADNALWRCFSEGQTPVRPSSAYDDGCQSLKDYAWARTDELPPVTTAEQDEETRAKIVRLYEDQGTRHGLTGVGTCAVTRNTDRFDTISTDIEQAGADKIGQFTRQFNLHANIAVTYIGSLTGPEDNCDQGFYHIQVKDKPEDEPTEDVTEETTEETSEAAPEETASEATPDESTTEPSDEPTTKPSEETSEEMTDESSEESTTEPSTEESTEETTEDTTEESTEKSSGKPSEETSEESTTEPSEEATTKPAEKMTDKPSDKEESEDGKKQSPTERETPVKPVNPPKDATPSDMQQETILQKETKKHSKSSKASSSNDSSQEPKSKSTQGPRVATGGSIVAA
ncbi:hypothetical protein GC425_08560 [Corynebacterium sp. zg254]|uniref:Peptidase n=1 Tax=Corynebacterium zhongnanshanii TaxID=2768834 RepID=A0ABQ6VD97_9CORY|nr:MULTISPECIES: hypothetical protein [Corynebacterium]KAB3519954.1 hypothetical protein F8377_08600 [Corynebacterium zhongnanshanii]MCR5914902.1 hypothetical protein [Corynebacterium sp. zg254]